MLRAEKLYCAFVLATASIASGAQVWQSTFDSTADGVVDVKNNDTTIVMIGPASGGRLQISTKDRGSFGNTGGDRAGRPLGVTLNGFNSFSALYKFRWSSLPASATEMWEGFGFTGSDACVVGCACTPNVCDKTKQNCGALFRHRQDTTTGEFFVRMGLLFGESGNGSNFTKTGPEINLGVNATASDLQVVIAYDGSSHVLSQAMYDSAGTLLGGVSADLDAATGGLLPGAGHTVADMLNGLAMTHLGWNDYSSGTNGGLVTVWQVDSLTYYNNATDAYNAVAGQPTGACCANSGPCVENQTEGACSGIGGNLWGGAGSACGTTTCPPQIGACCHPDGSCSQETQTDCAALSGTWQGANTACTLTSCPQPPTGACCSNLDGSCIDGKSQYNCAGTWQGANTQCATLNPPCPPPPPGACCLPNGACIAVSSGQCALQCGTFNGAGSSCASASCAQPATGACCQSNGTCTMTHEYDCNGAFHGSGSDCASANCQPMPDLVWWSNFATGNDGVVDVKNNNLSKDLIGPQCNGQLQINNRASPANFVNTDRGGRAVGTALNGNNSFSGLYRFRWSDLGESDSVTNELVTFIGNASNSTQQVLGMMLVHNKTAAGDYFVRMCSAGGENANYFLFQCGATFNLGPDAETRNFQIAITYDGHSHLLTHAILDDQGNLLGTAPNQSFQSWDLDTNCPSTVFCDNSTTDGVGCQNYFDCAVPCPTCTKQTRYDTLALTHLGWSDYASLSGTTQDTIWQMDSLAYFNTAGGAYNGVFGPVPRGACCRADGTCADNDTELACKAGNGAWNGSASTCANTTCAGACCLPDATCTDNQTVASCSAAQGTFQGLNTSCSQGISCPLPPCKNPFADADNDGDVDMDDFGVFERCFSGPGLPYTTPGICHCFDRDNDNDVDGDDFVNFQNCASGSKIPADPACDGPP